jgi:hypothetical protein
MKIYLGTIFCYKFRVMLLLVRYRYSPRASISLTRVADPCSYYTDPDPEFPKKLDPDSETKNAAFFRKFFINVR